jgi:hypothetical protein
MSLDDTARLCVLAYRVPLALLDNILEGMPPEDQTATHWIVASDDLDGMQAFNTLWSMRARIAMCMFPTPSEAADEALFDIFSVEWPTGLSCAVVLCCEGQRPWDSIAELESLAIDVSLPLNAASRLVALELSRRVRTVTCE